MWQRFVHETYVYHEMYGWIKDQPIMGNMEWLKTLGTREYES